MVLKGTVTDVAPSEIVVELDKAFGASKVIRIQAPAHSTYSFASGDRVVWWPVWSLQADSGWTIPLRLNTFERLVREADLGASELASVESEITNERENDDREAAYNALITARSREPSTEHE